VLKHLQVAAFNLQ